MRSWCCSVKSPAETPPWRRLERSVERRLDAPPDTEEVTIPAVLANDHQPEGRTHRPYRHGNSAAIEEIDNRRVVVGEPITTKSAASVSAPRRRSEPARQADRKR